MQTDTATLLALLAAPLAVIAVVVALATGLVARRGARSLGTATVRLGEIGLQTRDQLRTARAACERMSAAAVTLQAQGLTLDEDIAAWTASLVEGRTSLERMTRSRLAPAVRVVQLASALARVALLWRMPAR